MMDYNEIIDYDQLDVIEFTEFEKFKKELFSVDNLSGTDNLPENDKIEINLNENLSNIKNEKLIKTKKRKKSTLKCEICGYLFLTNARYERHKLNHFRKIVLQCNVCGTLFSNRVALINHIKLYHMNIKGERQNCIICGKSVLQMDVHMQNHTNAKFKCDKCKKCFRSNSYYVEHYKTHFETKEFHCEICGGDFTRKRYLHIHMAKHERKLKRRRYGYGAKKIVSNKDNESEIIQRTIGCDTSDLQSNITEGVVVLFPRPKWQENQQVTTKLILADEKWMKALYSSQSVDTSDIDYYLDLLRQCSI